jgi:SAM-dependent methyltransferase
MNPFMKLREFAKDLLSPYPAIYNPTRRVHRWLYQRSKILHLRIGMLFMRPLYKWRYRTFWEKRGMHMADRELECQEPDGWRGEEKKLVVERVVELAPLRVLEFGCGYGRILKSLKEKLTEAFICGCDISFSNLKKCKGHLSNSTASLLQVDGRFGLPFKDKSFDVVFTCGVLVHIPPPSDIALRQELLRIASKYIVHCEVIGDGTYHFRYDNKAIYSSMGYDVEELQFPIEQDFLNPRQFILVRAKSKL